MIKTAAIRGGPYVLGNFGEGDDGQSAFGGIEEPILGVETLETLGLRGDPGAGRGESLKLGS